jgi:capsid protein
MLKYVGKDSDVVQVQAQQPMNQTPDFIRVMCRMIGLPFDMPLELVLKDVSQVNFSSARVGLIGYYRACRSRQRAFISRCLSRIYRWWISREAKKQALGLPDSFTIRIPDDSWNHAFAPVGWDYTDPVSEAQADLLQIDMGIKTQRMACEERGRDWEEIQAQRSVERMARKLNELPEVGSQMTRDRVEVETQPDPEPAEQDVADDPEDDVEDADTSDTTDQNGDDNGQ